MCDSIVGWSEAVSIKQFVSPSRSPSLFLLPVCFTSTILGLPNEPGAVTVTVPILSSPEFDPQITETVPLSVPDAGLTESHEAFVFTCQFTAPVPEFATLKMTVPPVSETFRLVGVTDRTGDLIEGV